MNSPWGGDDTLIFPSPVYWPVYSGGCERVPLAPVLFEPRCPFFVTKNLPDHVRAQLTVPGKLGSRCSCPEVPLGTGVLITQISCLFNAGIQHGGLHWVAFAVAGVCAPICAV